MPRASATTFFTPTEREASTPVDAALAMTWTVSVKPASSSVYFRTCVSPSRQDDGLFLLLETRAGPGGDFRYAEKDKARLHE
jgi:hypothetical protein